MIREPAEQSRSSISSQPTESTDRKGNGILIKEPKKKSKKSSSSTPVPESVRSTPVEEEKKSDKVVKSNLNVNPESSTLQSIANPEASYPDEDSTRNPDGTANPDGDSTNWKQILMRLGG